MEGDGEEGKSFKDLGLCEQLLEACDRMNWKYPSKIQAEAIPHALEGKDLIGLALTGSGKTGAFALPILQSLLDSPQPFFACVLSPTRFHIYLMLAIFFNSFSVFYLLERVFELILHLGILFIYCFLCSRKSFELILHLGLFCFCFSRELAIQIAEQFEALGAGIGVKCAVVSFLFFWDQLCIIT